MRVTLLLLLLCSPFLHADESRDTLTINRGPVTLQIKADKRLQNGSLQLALSSRLVAKIILTSEDGFITDLPRVLRSENWQIEDKEWQESKSSANKHIQVREFVLEPIRLPGIEPLQLEPLYYRQPGQREWTKIDWPTIEVEVTSSVTRADLSELRDDLPLERLPKEETASLSWLWWTIGLMAMAVLILSGLLWMRARRPVKILPPDEQAIVALTSLDLTSAEVSTTIAHILRRFIEDHLGIQAVSTTTPVLLDRLSSSSIDSESLATLTEILHQCDQASFTGKAMETTEVEKWRSHAIEWIKLQSQTGLPHEST